MICDPWDVVIVPFPFTDKAGEKRRPALAISQRSFNAHGHTVLAMITSTGHASWPGDTALVDLDAAGLHVPCIVRLKLFTLDNRLILNHLGRLAPTDAGQVAASLRSHII